MKRRFALPLAVGFALSPCVCLAAEMYRWVDAQGNVHLSETPPEGGAAEVWKPKPLETAPAIPSAQQRRAPAKPRAAAHATGATNAASASAEPKVAGRTEPEWRREALDKQQAIAELESKLQAVEEGPEFSSTTFKRNAYGGKYAVGGSSKSSVLLGLRNELSRAQTNLEHFEDYARELGVPAGWLR